MTFKCYVFVEDTDCLLIRGAGEKNCEKYYLRNFLTVVFFVYFSFVEKEWINVAGKKVEIFALILYTEIELFCSAFGNKQKKLYAHVSLTEIDCIAEKRFCVPLM